MRHRSHGSFAAPPRPEHGVRIGAALAGVLLAVAAPGNGCGDVLVRRTADLRLVYRDVVHSPFEPYVGQCFENAMGFYRRVGGYAPSEPVTVLLDDAYDFNNAAAFAVPRNTLVVQIAPASMVYETLPSNERLNHTLNHELAHIVALDRTHGWDRSWRGLFRGKVALTPDHPETVAYQYLTAPRFAAPRWFHEGFAVFLETWMAGGIGRAQGAYDEMVFRSMVRDSSRFFDALGLESEGTKIDFQAGAMAYLYGTRFIAWLGHEYGPEKVLAWGAGGKGTGSYYAAAFHDIFASDIDTEWARWIAWEHGFQQRNLEAIRRYPCTPFRDLSRAPVGSVSRAFVDPTQKWVYAGVRPAAQFGRLVAMSLADGSLHDLCEVKGPALYSVTSLAYDPEGNLLFYTTDNNDWRDLVVYDLRTRKGTRTLHDARIGDLVFDRTDRALWGIRHFNGISTLVRIPPPYRSWNQIHSWPYGQDAYDIDVSPDGSRLVFSQSSIDGRQTLRMLDLAAMRHGEYADRQLHDFEASVPANFVFSPDGRFLYGSSYYTGVSNIWRYDVGHDSMAVVSNGETGLFRPACLGTDSLLVFRYTGSGFVPSVIEPHPLSDLGAITFLGQVVAQEHPVVESWNAGSPARVMIDSLTLSRGPYRPWRELRLESVYPVVEGYKTSAGPGVAAVISDPGLSTSLQLSASFTPTDALPEDEQVHLGARLRHGAWSLRFKHNGADFYDLSGPTKTSRKGQALGVKYEHRLLDDKPRHIDLAISSTGYRGLERVPYAQNIGVTFSRLLATRIEVSGQNVRRSLGAVDDERGRLWSAYLINNTFASSSVTAFAATLDLGAPLPVEHTSLWLRTAAGYSPGPRDEPFANFYFGGFGNNRIDHGTEKRYRDWDSFPGMELNAAGGTTFAKALVECNLPPLRFRRLGRQALYVTWLRPAIFATGLTTDFDRGGARRSFADAGAQVDLRFTLLSRLSMTLSGGGAWAVEKNQPASHEWMVSLKVL